MSARIYQPSKTAMSSGVAKTKEWVLEFAASKPRRKDPLTGWNSADETQTQVRLNSIRLRRRKPMPPAKALPHALTSHGPRKERLSLIVITSNSTASALGRISAIIRIRA